MDTTRGRWSSRGDLHKERCRARRPCLKCGKVCPLGLYQPALRRFGACSQICLSVARLRVTAWNDLQRRLLGIAVVRRLRFKELAKSIGIAEAPIRSWFRDSERTLRRRVFEAIATFVSLETGAAITVDAAIAEAGGRTAEDRSAERGRSMSPVSEAAHRRPTVSGAGGKRSGRRTVDAN